MVETELLPGFLAIVLGVAAGALLFVPFVAISYRRRGALTIGRSVLWAAALVYFWAIWTYTLLPPPAADTVQCAGTNLNPLQFLDDIGGALSRAGGHPVSALSDPALLQLLMNIMLFLPLGFLIRVLGGHGVVIAGVVGLGLSVFIETTQLTGVWGLYPCAYRVFDVDDMLTNTVGALLGSLVALIVPVRQDAGATVDADAPRPVTKPRRLIAMACDGIGFVLVSAAVSVAAQIWWFDPLDERGAALPDTVVSHGPPAAAAALWLLIVLSTGRTVGDLAVRLRYVGGPLPTWLSRVVRYLGGIGGYALLGLLPGSWSGLASAYLMLLVIMTLCTRRGRGLPGVLAHQELEDAREPATRNAETRPRTH